MKRWAWRYSLLQAGIWTFTNEHNRMVGFEVHWLGAFIGKRNVCILWKTDMYRRYIYEFREWITRMYAKVFKK